MACLPNVLYQDTVWWTAGDHIVTFTRPCPLVWKCRNKNQNTPTLTSSLWCGGGIHPLFLLSLHPVASTALVLVCAFFMFFIQRLCIRLVLEMLLSAHIPSNWAVIGQTSGRGRVTGRDKQPVCTCASACFLSLNHRNNVIWFSSHIGTPPTPLPHLHSFDCCCTICVYYVPDHQNVLNEFNLRLFVYVVLLWMYWCSLVLTETGTQGRGEGSLRKR